MFVLLLDRLGVGLDRRLDVEELPEEVLDDGVVLSSSNESVAVRKREKGP